ncbi:MAG: MBL fold metallo-hydrolase [Brevundimonas sp.]
MPLREVADGVLVATSAVYSTSSVVLVGHGGDCLLVDPGVTAGEIAAFAEDVRTRGLSPVAVWSTHHHWDHLLDGPALSHLPRWGVPVRPGRLPGLRNLLGELEASDELAEALAQRPGDVAATIASPPAGFPVEVGPGPGQVLAWDGPTVVVLTHHAHAPAHTALHLPSAGVLVAGDMLSDVEVPLLDLEGDDPLGDYRAGLALLAGTAARVVVPGHGHAGIDLAARVARDEAYLDSLAAAPDDPRLSVPWLREADAQQRALTPPAPA